MRAKTVTTHTKSCLELRICQLSTILLIQSQKNNDLFPIHFNLRSLQKHIDQINNYLVGFKNQPDIVAISDTKLKEA